MGNVDPYDVFGDGGGSSSPSSQQQNNQAGMTNPFAQKQQASMANPWGATNTTQQQPAQQQPQQVNPFQQPRQQTNQQSTSPSQQPATNNVQSATVLEQGNSYNPKSSGSDVQQAQPGDTAGGSSNDTGNGYGSAMRQRRLAREQQGRENNVVGGFLSKLKDNKIATYGIAGVAGIGLCVLIGAIFLKDISVPSVGNKGNAATPTTSIEEEYDEYGDSDEWFTDYEVEDLRMAGYTGWEIEDFAVLELDAYSLIEEAEQARIAKYEAEAAPYRDSVSPEVQAMRESTWLGLDPIDMDVDASNVTYYMETANLDYEKVEPRGYQLFLKVYLEDGTYFFVSVLPDRWVQLREQGNILVDIKEALLPNGTKIIVDAYEHIY